MNTYDIHFNEKQDEKPDAYIDDISPSSGVSLNKPCVIWQDEYGFFFTDRIKKAYQYNILSEKEYFRRHPIKKKPLKFNGWFVTPEDDRVYIGCTDDQKRLEFPKEVLNIFMHVCRKAIDYNADLDSVYAWLKENKEKLDL